MFDPKQLGPNEVGSMYESMPLPEAPAAPPASMNPDEFNLLGADGQEELPQEGMGMRPPMPPPAMPGGMAPSLMGMTGPSPNMGMTPPNPGMMAPGPQQGMMAPGAPPMQSPGGGQPDLMAQLKAMGVQ